MLLIYIADKQKRKSGKILTMKIRKNICNKNKNEDTNMETGTISQINTTHIIEHVSYTLSISSSSAYELVGIIMVKFYKSLKQRYPL